MNNELASLICRSRSYCQCISRLVLSTLDKSGESIDKLLIVGSSFDYGQKEAYLFKDLSFNVFE